MKLRNPIKAAKKFANTFHSDQGQMYGKHPYVEHLEDVVQVMLRYNVTDKNVLAAGYLHDVIEDCEIPKEVLSVLFGERVSQLVWAVTDEEGANRKERKAKVYIKIKETGPDALTVKLADRIANVENSIRTGELRMLKMYQKEHDGFRQELDPAGSHFMWEHLDFLIDTGKLDNEAGDVHTSHCCEQHKQCKYGDPHCTVATGRKRAEYRCNCFH